MDPLLSRITIDPAICHGSPCVRGLRYPVEMLLELLSSGMTPEEILADYPDLERDDLRAATAYAARVVHSRRLQAVGPHPLHRTTPREAGSVGDSGVGARPVKSEIRASSVPAAQATPAHRVFVRWLANKS